MGLAAGLPLVVLVGAVIFVAYRASTEQTYATVEQTCFRYAAQFEGRLNAKLGLLQGLVALGADDPRSLSRLMALDPDLKEIWMHREGQPFTGETPLQRELYETVKASGREVLTEPDFTVNQAALGLPIVDNGRFAGMVAVRFGLDYFQKTVLGVHLYSTGYAALISSDGFRIAHPKTNMIGVRVGNDVSAREAVDMLAKIKAGQAFWLEKKALLTGKWSRQYYAPVTAGQAANPWVLNVIVPVEEATFSLDSLFLVLLAGSLVILVLLAVVTWRNTRRLVLPLHDLAAKAEAISGGDFDARVLVTSDDEFGTVAAAFNHMTERLVSTLRDQEHLVQDRTASLERSLAELERAHEKILASEKLAVLGQLTATIAHEVNTPLGAIRSSANFLAQALAHRVELSPGDVPSPESVELYNKLTHRDVKVNYTVGGSERRRRRDLVAQLEAEGVENADSLADDIVLLAAPDEEDKLVSAVRAGQAPVIRAAAQSAAMAQSGAIILEAADRAASTVSALVNYTRLSDLGSAESIDPAREFETILTLYYGPTKKRVEIVKEFEPGVTFVGDRDKLSHVWVNLINNALQAMSYRGTLLLRIRTEPEAVRVDVANDGPPVPPELKAKIFEPFFTTKPASEGTGLGLDICRRIVEAHHGTLTLSEEGPLTVFSVRLPKTFPETSHGGPPRA
jgi:signal transduction histidine kinase